MTKLKFLGARFIIYYNLILPSLMLIGSIIMFTFSHIKETTQKDVFKLPLLLFIVLCIFYILSSAAYLKRKNIGRICLLVSCALQILNSIRDIIMEFRAFSTFSFFYVLMILVGLYGLWYLNTEEAKDWLKLKQE